MTRLLMWAPVLAVLWVLLQGDLTVGNVVAGLAVGALVVLAVPLAPAARRHRIHPLGLLRYVLFVLWNLVTSSVVVVVTSIRPTPERVRSGIVRVDLPGAAPLVTTLVANAITLTPGTLTVSAETGEAGGVLHVHVLGLGDVEEFRASIADLHRRARRAFEPTAETAGPTSAGPEAAT